MKGWDGWSRSPAGCSEWQILVLNLDEAAPLIGALLLRSVLILRRGVLVSGRAVLIGRRGVLIGGRGVLVCRCAAGMALLAILAGREEFHVVSLDLQAGPGGAVVADIRPAAHRAHHRHLAALGQILLAYIRQATPDGDPEIIRLSGRCSRRFSG